MDMNKVHRK